MENQNTKVEIKKPLSPRTLTFIKYILTFAYVLFYTIPALGFIDSLGRWDLSKSTLMKLQIILVIFAIISLAVYAILRFNLHRKTTYKYNKNEKILLTIFIVTSILILILSTVFAFFEIGDRDYKSQIMFYIFEPIIIILGIVGSMLEQRARINEQITIYNVWYEKLDSEEKAKEENVKNKKTKSEKEVVILENDNLVEKEIKNKSNPFMDNESSEKDD